MGTFSTPKKDDIEMFLASRGIDCKHAYVVAQPRDSILRQVVALLISNLAAAMDASRIRIIALTPKELVVINPSWQTVGELKDLPDKYVKSYPLEQLEELSVEAGSRNGRITWKYAGKRETWKVALSNPGVFHFNPANFEEIKTILEGKKK